MGIINTGLHHPKISGAAWAVFDDASFSHDGWALLTFIGCDNRGICHGLFKMALPDLEILIVCEE